MSDENEEKPARAGAAVSLPITVVVGLLSAMLAGGSGSYLTGSSVSATLRESMVRLEAQVQALRDDVRRQGDDSRASLARTEQRQSDVEARLRAVELHQAREPSPR